MKLKVFIFLSFILFASIVEGQTLKNHLKFATVYGAVNGGTSISDVKTFSVTSGELQEGLIQTPYDYSVTFGIRKIARFGYENKAKTFY